MKLALGDSSSTTATSLAGERSRGGLGRSQVVTQQTRRLGPFMFAFKYYWAIRRVGTGGSAHFFPRTGPCRNEGIAQSLPIHIDPTRCSQKPDTC